MRYSSGRPSRYASGLVEILGTYSNSIPREQALTGLHDKIWQSEHNSIFGLPLGFVKFCPNAL
jgi:hypothetical protein